MLGPARALWWAIVGLHDEIFLLLRANLIWFVTVLPVALLLSGTPLVSIASRETAVSTIPPLFVTGFLLLVVPGPATLGLCSLAATMTRRDSPPFSQLLTTLRRDWRLGLATMFVGLLGVGLLGSNVWFYWSVTTGLVRWLSVLWLYLLVFWIGMQLYLGPVAELLGERRLFHLYRRAAVLAVANPLQTFCLLLVALVVATASLLAAPLYLLVAMAYLALVSTRMLDDLRARFDRSSEADSAP
ncbi:MAG: hypothetical protein IT307_03275 [Chloroflexi bacterium]|nr:hypothetical protein [Chloroflexota bacterium]